MADPEHLAILKQGVEVWNQWRIEQDRAQRPLKVGLDYRVRLPDLSGATLEGFNLRAYNLSGVDLSQAVLHRADFQGALLYLANMSHADFDAAHCQGVFFGEGHYLLDRAPEESVESASPILLNVNFRWTDLQYATFTRVDLDGSDFTGAFLAN